MSKSDRKETFVLSVEHKENILRLNIKERGYVFTAILEYADVGNIDSVEESLSDKAHIVFGVIKSQIDRFEKRRKQLSDAGKQGGAPKGNQNAKKDKDSSTNKQEQTESSTDNQEQSKTSKIKQKQPPIPTPTPVPTPVPTPTPGVNENMMNMGDMVNSRPHGATGGGEDELLRKWNERQKDIAQAKEGDGA